MGGLALVVGRRRRRRVVAAHCDKELWRQLYKNRASRKIDSQIIFSRAYDFPKTFSLTWNKFSGKTYFNTIPLSLSLGTNMFARSSRRRWTLSRTRELSRLVDGRVRMSDS